MPMGSTERFRQSERRLWESVGVEPSERYVQLRAGGMVRVQETGDGPPVLLVHGAVNAGTSWMSLMAKLPDFRCIALDRPGCGLSDPIGGGPVRGIRAIESYAWRSSRRRVPPGSTSSTSARNVPGHSSPSDP
ncbi:MAG: alpha/beta fold hydrolase [Acidimicrobiales bacterium]